MLTEIKCFMKGLVEIIIFEVLKQYVLMVMILETMLLV